MKCANDGRRREARMKSRRRLTARALEDNRAFSSKRAAHRPESSEFDSCRRGLRTTSLASSRAPRLATTHTSS